MTEDWFIPILDHNIFSGHASVLIPCMHTFFGFSNEFGASINRGIPTTHLRSHSQKYCDDLVTQTHFWVYSHRFRRFVRGKTVKLQRARAYTLFQNGRHFSILLFTCKLALVSSVKGKYSWQQFWNKVY